MKSQLVIGLDIGGTKIRAGAVSKDGQVVNSETMPTEAAKGKAAILRNIEAAIASVSKGKAAAIGIGIAGLVDHDRGIYVQGPNLPKSFQNVPLVKLLTDKLKIPVTIDNDAHCFALAEAVFGAGHGHKTVVGVTLGTGIGGGVVMDGQIFRGRDNAAGEIGHMTIGLNHDAVCGCGQTGHFEALASGNAMAKLYKTKTGNQLAPVDVENAAKSGEKEAQAVISEMAESLAVGIASIIHAFDPDMVVVGGGLAKANILWEPAIQKIREKLIYGQLRDIPVVRAALGPDAGVIGAALLTGKIGP
ncbi:hypothetical protein A3C96_01945 [Candidatus Uhrbacteria bacterium RIFCSPHIGHO2_02_FULL_60_10]|uniref:Glucokinase n=1 Tax=Candidatus Uhrbacteria bacterium RIFCSPHIGHO2_02_FULL_60_10 TaxID=1802392 RepID=A0A1F7U9X6_9BACT|nr:MAG: hypothetical protein A3C96_01945 [Candidatus Uhrbacteria bacterium RIFCSPHIGHO2_02_FULL_60_10]